MWRLRDIVAAPVMVLRQAASRIFPCCAVFDQL
jgi:hypothetical protein